VWSAAAEWANCSAHLCADAAGELVGVYDAIPKVAEAVAAEFGTKVIANLEELAEMVSQ